MARRIEQIDELIKREIGAMLLKELEIPSDIFITVSKVKTSRDLKYAQVFITVLPDNKAGTALDFLQKKAFLVNKHLAAKLTTKFSPRVTFLIDETEKQAQEIENILDQIASQ